METIIACIIITIILLIAAPYLIWSAIKIIPRLLWACSKVMSGLIMLIILIYVAGMIIEYNEASMEKKNENIPPAIINEEN